MMWLREWSSTENQILSNKMNKMSRIYINDRGIGPVGGGGGSNGDDDGKNGTKANAFFFSVVVVVGFVVVVVIFVSEKNGA